MYVPISVVLLLLAMAAFAAGGITHNTGYFIVGAILLVGEGVAVAIREHGRKP